MGDMREKEAQLRMMREECRDLAVKINTLEMDKTEHELVMAALKREAEGVGWSGGQGRVGRRETREMRESKRRGRKRVGGSEGEGERERARSVSLAPCARAS